MIAHIDRAPSLVAFEGKIDAIEEAKFFSDGKLPQTKQDVAKVLKLIANKPLTDKEIGKAALKQIVSYENIFCPKATCKGYKEFAFYLRGAEPLQMSNADEKRKQGNTRFEDELDRIPNLTNPLEANVVDALAFSDLSKITKKPVKKVKAVKKPKK